MRGGGRMMYQKNLIRQYLLKLAFSARFVVRGSEAYGITPQIPPQANFKRYAECVRKETKVFLTRWRRKQGLRSTAMQESSRALAELYFVASS